MVLEASGICKSFPGVKVLTDVSITLHRGEVVALLGENGAGKSTLIKVLSGIYQPDAGEIRMDGQTVRFDLPLQARDAGIGVIHQELNYVPTISIAENIFMGKLPKKHGFVDYKTMYAESSRILKKVGLELDPRMQISACAVAQKQLIEIAKVLSADARVLILDEPTSALNDVETNYLFDLIRRASEAGIAILYISHKLEELFAIADRVVVLRDGCVTGELNIRETNKSELIARMVGRELTDLFPKTSNPIGDVALEVDHLTTEAFQDVSFSLHKGEILAFSGLVGAGRTEVAKAIFGAYPKSGGKVFRLSDVYYGLNLQMLIYLFSISRNGKGKFADAIPAGVLYLPSDGAVIAAKRGDSDENITAERRKHYRMNGLILNDIDSITGMDRSRSGFFIPAMFGKSGNLQRADVSASLASLEELGKISGYIDELTVQMASTLLDGDVAAVPVDNGLHCACEFCDYGEICRRDSASEVRSAVSFRTKQEFYAAIENEMKGDGEDAKMD